MEFALGYGDGNIRFSIPEANFSGEVRSAPVSLPGFEGAFSSAWASPHGFPAPLDAVITKGKRLLLIVPDHTRKLPTEAILRAIWTRLSREVSSRDVTVLVATGTHRATRPDELASILGEFRRLFRVVVHDAEGKHVRLGTTSFGTPVEVNRLVCEVDYVITVGHIGMHYFAGYSGGPKMILPGVAGAETIRLNHERILDANAYACIYEDNPIHREMREAAGMAGVWACVDVVLSGDGEPLRFFIGALPEAHRAGAAFWDGIFQVRVPERADLVITSPGGYPKDINLYQAHKAIFNAARAVKDGGIILLIAECRDGIGHPVFADWGKRAWDLAGIREIMGAEGFKIGGHKAYFFARDRARGIRHLLFSSLPPDEVRALGLEPVVSVEEALSLARDAFGPNFSVLLMPHGSDTFPVVGQEVVGTTAMAL